MKSSWRSFFLFIVSIVTIGTACSGTSGPPPFEIVTPNGTRVSVLPGGSARFEVRINDLSFSAEYLVDGVSAHEGPVFVFEPTGPTHTVTLRIESSQPGEPPFVQTFTVVIEVPGNLLPQIVSSTFEPETDGEAQRDTFTFTITATDPDGSIAAMTLDFGDGSPLATSNGSPLVADHVYADPGTYTLTATATDDVQIEVMSEFTVFVQPPNQLPTGQITVNGLVSGGPVDGTTPFTVRLGTSGNDVDGTIEVWELDADDGNGFQVIGPGETIEVAYPFRSTTYRPVLRLTDDDGDSAEIPSAVEVRVFRDIDADRSTADVSGNPALAGLPIAPAIFANGNDALQVDVRIVDHVSNPVAGVPLRLIPLRPELVTPSGTNLGVPASVEGGVTQTDGAGRASATVTTQTSTRVEGIPEVEFVPFTIAVEAGIGHGQFVEVVRTEGANAASIVDPDEGRPFVLPTGGANGYCAGDLVEIHVSASIRNGLPGAGGPAPNRYTEIRFAQFENPAPLAVQPAQGFGNWRTNNSGAIVFNYVPTAEDANRAITAWVDGQPLNQLGTIAFAASCP